MFVTVFDPVEMEKRAALGMKLEADVQRGLPHQDLTWRQKGHTWHLEFLGASSSMHAVGRDPHQDVTNYFRGDEYAIDVRGYQEVWYHDVYEQIDVRYYPAEDGSLEYDIICAPGSDPAQVAVRFNGIDRMRVSDDGSLVLSTSLGDMAIPKPFVYQKVNGREKEVASRYVVQDGNVVRFELDRYDRTIPLIIDPIAMRWATWLNTNSTGDNHGHCIWVDPSDGAIYIVSRVVGTTDLITPGAFDQTANGNLEIIVGKYLEPQNVGESGTRVWQTYIGGNGDDNPYAMEQGPDGHLYITGNSTSTNFPLLGGPVFSGTSLDQQAQSGTDIFITKINTAGTSIKSAVIGGDGGDLSFDLRIDSNGEVIVCGYTNSDNLATTNPGSGAVNSNAGGNDVIIFKIDNDLDAMHWLKNYGGSSNDQANIMLQAASGDIFVGGTTSSSNFPLQTPRQSTRGGDEAGFLQRLSGTGSTIWSSYFSSSNNNEASILCMAFNNDESEIYFGGVTTGLNSSNISGSGVFDSSHNGSNDFYVTRMEIDQDLVASTYVGGSANEVNMMGLNTDLNSDVYVFGYSNSTNFPVSTSPNVPLQGAKQGSSTTNDKVFLKLTDDLSLLEFSTYYGGSADDYDPVGERGIKFSNCRIYTIVTARSNNIPLTEGALNTTKQSSTSRYEPGLVVWANPPDLLDNSITGSQSVCEGDTPGDIFGSIPSYTLPTIVRNNVASPYPSLGQAATYQWQISNDSLNWSDIPGATSQNLSGSMIGPVNEKTYVRRIIGGDACILAGAADQVVTVKLISVSADVTHVSCNGGSDGSITASSDGEAPFQYEWSHGPTTATITDLPAGTYTVVVTDVNQCSAEGTFQVTEPPVLAVQMQSVDASCNDANGSATAIPSGGTAPYTYLWSNGSTSSQISGVPGGSYDVVVTDLNNCTVQAFVTIGSSGVPDVDAGASQTITCATGPTVQMNGSSATPGAAFNWTATDGGNIVSGADTPSPTVDAAGTYTLEVSANGCSSVSSTTVTMDVTVPQVDLLGGIITCNDPMVTLNGFLEDGIVSFEYTGPNGFSSTEVAPEVSEPGVYTLTVVGANGCQNSSSTEVGMDNSVPDVSAEGGTITCTEVCVMLMGGSMTQGVTYSWSGPDGFTSDVQNVEVCIAGTYTLTVTAANGCTSTDTAEVGLDTDAPGATATGGTITCSEECVMLMGSSMTEGVTYAWSGPDGFTSDAQNVEVCVAGTYTLTVTAANGCTSTDTAEVGLDTDAPGATATGGTITCSEECVMLMGSSMTEGVTYAWSGPDGFTSDAQNVEVCVAGTYTLTVTAANGCTSTDTAEIGMDNSVPGVSAEGGTITCSEECVMLMGSSMTEGVTYAWSGPDGFTSDAQNVEVCVAGTYTLTVTAANGCTSTALAEVGMDNSVPDVSAEGGTITCTEECVMLIGGSMTQGVTYSWSGPDGFTSDVQNVEVCIAGTYTLTVTAANGCSASDVAMVTMDTDPPLVDVVGGEITCSEECITLTASSTTEGVSFSWSGNNVSMDGAELEVCEPGVYTVTVVATNGCITTATTEVTLAEDLTIEVTGVCESANGGTAAVTVLTGGGGYEFLWSNMETTSSIGGLSSGTYSVSVTDVNGCTSTGEVTLVCPDTCALTIVVETGCVAEDIGWASVDQILNANGTTTILWSTGETTSYVDGLAYGEHWVLVTDENGCTDKQTFNIDCKKECELEIVVESGCLAEDNGWASVDQVLNGTAPVTILWSTGESASFISGLDDGAHWVMVTDAEECWVKYDFNIACEKDCDLQVEFASECMDATGTASLMVSGADEYSILWSTLETSASINGLSNGEYWYMVSTSKDCFVKEEFTVECDPVVTDILENGSGAQTGSLSSTIEVYPNPAQDLLNINFSAANAGTVTIAMLDISGRMVRNIGTYQTEAGKERAINLDLNEVRSGVYLLKFSQDGSYHVERIVINR